METFWPMRERQEAFTPTSTADSCNYKDNVIVALTQRKENKGGRVERGVKSFHVCVKSTQMEGRSRGETSGKIITEKREKEA